MSRILLNFSRDLVNASVFNKRINFANIYSLNSHNKSQVVEVNSEQNQKKSEEDVENSEPIIYTKSQAFKYKASENFRVKEEELSYSPYTSFIIRLSVSIFMIYFCFVREPNDIDEILSQDLFTLKPDLEVKFLEIEVKRLEQYGLDTRALQEKLSKLKSYNESENK